MGLRRVDPYKKRLNKAIRQALTKVGQEAVADLRKILSVRVEYVSGYGLIRSDPGESPRKEFGNLQKSMKYRVLPKAQNSESLLIYTNSIIAIYLEYGTEKIEPRPFWKKAVGNVAALRRRFKFWLKHFMEMSQFSDVDIPANDVALPEPGYEAGTIGPVRSLDLFSDDGDGSPMSL